MASDRRRALRSSGIIRRQTGGRLSFDRDLLWCCWRCCCCCLLLLLYYCCMLLLCILLLCCEVRMLHAPSAFYIYIRSFSTAHCCSLALAAIGRTKKFSTLVSFFAFRGLHSGRSKILGFSDLERAPYFLAPCALENPHSFKTSYQVRRMSYLIFCILQYYCC